MTNNFDGLTKQKWLKRSDKYCPRCGVKAVDKPTRRCLQCKGLLLWSQYDDATKAIEYREPWYMWTKPVNTNVLGWYPQAFWGVRYDK